MSSWRGGGRRRLHWALLKRFLRHTGLACVTWLNPVEADVANMHRVIDSVCERSEPLPNMVCHSSELVGGGAPHIRDEAVADRVCDATVRELDCANHRGGVQFMRLAESADPWSRPDPVQELELSGAPGSEQATIDAQAD
jgi:hypothetical protein